MKLKEYKVMLVPVLFLCTSLLMHLILFSLKMTFSFDEFENVVFTLVLMPLLLILIPLTRFVKALLDADQHGVKISVVSLLVFLVVGFIYYFLMISVMIREVLPGLN